MIIYITMFIFFVIVISISVLAYFDKNGHNPFK